MAIDAKAVRSTPGGRDQIAFLADELAKYPNPAIREVGKAAFEFLKLYAEAICAMHKGWL